MGLGQSSRRKSKSARIAEVVIALSLVAGGAYFGATKYQETQKSKGLVRQALKQTTQATKTAVKGVVTAPRSLVKIFLNPVEYEQKRQEKELKYLNARLTEDPEDIYSLAKRLEIHSLYGTVEEYQADLERLIVLEAPFLNYSHYNGRAYYQAKTEGDFQGALPRAEQAVKLAPDSIHCTDTLAYVYVGLARYEEAITQYDLILAVDPNRKDALWGRAAAWKSLGEAEKAKADRDKVWSVDRDFCLHWKVEPDPGSHPEKPD